MKNSKILTVGIIEDDADILKDWTAMFQEKRNGQIVSKMQNCHLDFAVSSMVEFEKYCENKEYQTQVILLDLFLGTKQRSGFDIMDYLKKRKNKPKVIVISSFCDDFNISETEKRGAKAHIKKSLLYGAKPEFLESIIHQVWRNDGFLTFLNSNTIQPSPKAFKLTDIQQEILQLWIKDGKSPAQIAKIKNVAPNSEHHSGNSRSNVYNTIDKLKTKLHVKTSTELIKKVIELNLLT